MKAKAEKRARVAKTPELQYNIVIHSLATLKLNHIVERISYKYMACIFTD